MLTVNSYYFSKHVICACTDSIPALVTGQLSKEITDAGKEIEKLFGVLNEELLQLQ